MNTDFSRTCQFGNLITGSHIVYGDASSRIVQVLDIVEFLDEFISCLIDRPHMDRIASSRQAAICAGQSE